CTANGESAQRTAERVRDGLQAQRPSGRIRVRELAPSINSAPGYRIAGLVIRREPAEENAAQEIRKIVDPVVSPGAFILTSSKQGSPSWPGTKGYISLFVCQ